MKLEKLGENSHSRRFNHDGYSVSCLWPCMRHCYDPGWTPSAHQSPFITPLVSWTGQQKYSKMIMGGDKDMERDCSPVTIMAKQTQLQEIILVSYQSNSSPELEKLPLTEAIPLAPHYQTLSTQMQYNCVPSYIRQGLRSWDTCQKMGRKENYWWFLLHLQVCILS